ncbi:uncharacterized protein METZ01_LOCUS444438 [marine metagenome]|uniref:Uncharacterized protein n=1 Tax=marine metagenome TaxID=408172 RepID=A0A382Z7V0_9ZZZZ
MSVAEVTTIGIQKQLLNERTEPQEANTAPEIDVSLQTSAGDVVTLSVADEQGLSQSYSEGPFEGGQTIQEISSIAQAASTFSQVVEGDLNEDELVAIQKLAAKIEPIAKDFLSIDPEQLDIGKAADMALPEVVSVETETPDFDVENIRQLPTLVSATIDAGFEKQFQALNKTNRELIVSSLSELMQFFREKVVQVLEPLRHPSSLTEGETQVPVEVDLVAQPQA